MAVVAMARFGDDGVTAGVKAGAGWNQSSVGAGNGDGGNGGGDGAAGGGGGDSGGNQLLGSW